MGKSLKKVKIFRQLPAILRVLREDYKGWKAPIVGSFASGENAPFKVLISTVLSLRTKDKTTEEASHRLFKLAETPQAMLALTPTQIEKAVYPVGFYRTKARTILRIADILIREYQGKVPDSIDELLKLKGVGRKTANLVVIIGYDKPGICVDTHVHRISNRWGLVKTKTPEETEFALRQTLPLRYWKEFNDLLVAYGQNRCVPISPFCSQCRIAQFCPQRGVRTRR